MSGSVFAIQSIFEIEDRASSVLVEIADAAERTTAIINNVSEALERLSGIRLSGLARSMNSVASAAERMATSGPQAETVLRNTGAAAADSAAGVNGMADAMNRASAAHEEMAARLSQQLVIPTPVYEGDVEAPVRRGAGRGGAGIGYSGQVVDSWAHEVPPVGIGYGGGSGGYAGGGGGYMSYNEPLALGYDGTNGATTRDGTMYGPYAGNAGRDPLNAASGFANPYAGGGGPTINMSGPAEQAETLAEGAAVGSRLSRLRARWNAAGGGGGEAPPASGGGRGGGGGHGGEPLFSIPALVGGDLEYHAIKNATGVDRDIRIGRLNMGDQEGARNEQSAGYQTALTTIDNAQRNTVASEAEVAHIYSSVRGEARGRFGTDAEFNSLFPSVVNYGELMKQYTGEAPATAGLAGFRLVDAFRADNDTDARTILSGAANLASLTHANATQEATILRYGLRTSAVDARHADPYLEYLAPAQQAMGNVSTVGTGASAFDLELVEAASHHGTPAQRRRADNQIRQFRAALRGTDELNEHDREHARGGSGTQHERSFQQLGLIDAAGNRTDLGADGVTDYAKRGEILRSAYQRLGPAGYQAAAIGAAGVRGGGFAMPLGAETGLQVEQYHEAIGLGPTVDQRKDIGQAAASQQFLTAEAAFSTALSKLGSDALPALTSAAGGAATALQHMGDFFHDHPTAATVGVDTGLAGAAGYLGYRILRSAPARAIGRAGSYVGGLFGRASETIASLEEGELGGAVGDLASGALNIGERIGGTALRLGRAANPVGAALFTMSPTATNENESTAVAGLRPSVVRTQPTTTSVGAVNVSVSVQGGAIKDMVDSMMEQLRPQILQQLTNAMLQSSMTSGGFGGGTHSSIFSVGGN